MSSGLPKPNVKRLARSELRLRLNGLPMENSETGNTNESQDSWGKGNKYVQAVKFPCIFFTWMVVLLFPLHAIGRTNTTVSILGEDFRINDKPTYAGRAWRGHRVEGLLFNLRMVQATFDDRNTNTVA